MRRMIKRQMIKRRSKGARKSMKRQMRHKTMKRRKTRKTRKRHQYSRINLRGGSEPEPEPQALTLVQKKAKVLEEVRQGSLQGRPDKNKIRKLKLKWHPDKNLDDEDATAMFQYLQECIDAAAAGDVLPSASPLSPIHTDIIDKVKYTAGAK